jgi:hypothetical protein
MNNILAFISAGTIGVIVNSLFKKREDMIGGGNNKIDLTKLEPDKINENPNGERIFATNEKKQFFPMFENAKNAKKLSETGVHLSVPGLMPASNSTWKNVDDPNKIYYMPNDLKPHYHGDAPHHMAMFDIDKVYEMEANDYFNTENKKITKYRNMDGIKKFNDGEKHTPVEVWIHWRIPYDGNEYPILIVKKNSIVWWDFTGMHNLVLVDSEQNYKNNNFNNSKLISQSGKDINTLVTFMNKVGKFYFACSIPGHAGNGHKIVIKVIN